MKKAIAGKEYLCIETVVMDNGKTQYIQGKKYKSENAGCITNEENDPYHIWTKKGMKQFFREACGIETEPEYVISKSKMEELRYLLSDDSHSGHHLRIEITKNILPHLFKEDKVELEVELEVGKWYKKDDLLCLIKCIDAKRIYFQRFNCYGFNTPTGYDNFCFDVMHDDCHSFELATPEEVTEALTKEAVKRGYKNGNHKCLNSCITVENVEDKYLFHNGNLWYGTKQSANCVFQKGEWAEIIPTISKEKKMQRKNLVKRL